jgi:hypothetical protein
MGSGLATPCDNFFFVAFFLRTFFFVALFLVAFFFAAIVSPYFPNNKPDNLGAAGS